MQKHFTSLQSRFVSNFLVESTTFQSIDFLRMEILLIFSFPPPFFPFFSIHSHVRSRGYVGFPWTSKNCVGRKWKIRAYRAGLASSLRVISVCPWNSFPIRKLASILASNQQYFSLFSSGIVFEKIRYKRIFSLNNFNKHPC